MRDAAAFQQTFGAALAGHVSIADPAIARALAVHRNTAAKAAIDALGDNYPVVRALVGDDAFAGVASDYVAVDPPRDPRLCLYGERLPDHLRGYAPFAELSYLPEVALLERMVIEALFAADADVADGATLALELERPLTLHPATRFAAFQAPAAALWLAHQSDPRGSLGEIAWQTEAVLVTRPANAIAVTVVPDAALDFLTACSAGQSLGEAAATVGDDLADVFATLIVAGAFMLPTQRSPEIDP